MGTPDIDCNILSYHAGYCTLLFYRIDSPLRLRSPDSDRPASQSTVQAAEGEPKVVSYEILQNKFPPSL